MEPALNVFVLESADMIRSCIGDAITKSKMGQQGYETFFFHTKEAIDSRSGVLTCPFALDGAYSGLARPGNRLLRAKIPPEGA